MGNFFEDLDKNPQQNSNWFLQDAKPEDDYRYPKAFYNGLIAQGGRGLLGAFQMVVDNQLNQAKDISKEYYPDVDMSRPTDADAPRNYANTASWLQDYNLQGKNKLDQFGLDFTSGAGQLARQMVGGAVAGPVGGTLTMFGDIAGNQYLEARNNGVDEDTAAKAAVGNYVVQAPLEYIGLSKIMEKLPKNMPLRDIATKYGERFLTEGLTEGIQEFPEQFSKIYQENPDATVGDVLTKWNASAGKNLQAAGYSGLLGGILGLGGGAVNDLARYGYEKKHTYTPNASTNVDINGNETPVDINVEGDNLATTKGMANVGNYMQDDDQWAGNDYAANNIGTSGCGVTALANFAKAYGLDITPAEVADFSIANGDSTDSGTGFGLYNDFAAKNLGMNMEQTEDFDSVKQALANGVPVIVGYDTGKWTDANGHVMVLSGLDANGNIIVQDSRTNKNMSGAYSDEDINRDGALFWIPSKPPTNMTVNRGSYNHSPATSTSDMLKYLEQNQYQFDADTNNAIDNALTTQNTDEVEKIFKEVKKTNDILSQQNQQNQQNENTSENNTKERPDLGDNGVPLLQSHIGNMVSRARAKNAPNVNLQRGNGIATSKNFLDNKLANSSLVNLAKRAFAGDKKAMQTFKSLRPNVQETLRRITNNEQGASAPIVLPSVQMKLENNYPPIASRPAGKSVQVITDNGQEFNAQYKVVEADDLITSHLPENSARMAKNPAYPAELQPRNRESVAMQQQVTSMVNGLRPADLGASRNLNNGAPLINAQGVVENGNGRSISIIRALKGKNKTNSGDAYRTWLTANAAEFGLTPEQIASVQNPVLVRQRTDDNVNVNNIINSTAGGAALSASEQAKTDAKKLTEGTLAKYVENDFGDLLTGDNKEFVTDALKDLTGNNAAELNSLVTSDGRVSQQGITRIKNALFAKAYGDEGLLALMSESTDNNIKNITNALINSAPAFAKLNDKIANGLRQDIDVTSPIAEACGKLMWLRNEGMSVDGYLLENENALFGEESGEDISENAKDVLQFMDKNKRSTRSIRNMFMFMADTIDAMGDPRQISLLSGETIPTAGEVINLAIADNAREKDGLFAQTANKEDGLNVNKTEMETSNTQNAENRNENSQSGQTEQAEATEGDRTVQGETVNSEIPTESKGVQSEIDKNKIKSAFADGGIINNKVIDNMSNSELDAVAGIFGIDKAAAGKKEAFPKKKGKAEYKIVNKSEKLIPQTVEIRDNEVTVTSKPSDKITPPNYHENYIYEHLPVGSYSFDIKDYANALGRHGNEHYATAQFLMDYYVEAFKDSLPNDFTNNYRSRTIVIPDPVADRLFENQCSAVEDAYKQYAADHGEIKQIQHDAGFERLKTRPEQPKQAKQQRFNSERGKSAMDKLFKKKENNVAKDTIEIGEVFHVDAAKEKALADRIKAKLNRLNANPMFDPELMVDLFQYGGIKLQRGVNSFAKWSAEMADAFSEKVRPFLDSVWSALQTYPSNVEFDESKMSAVMDYVGGMVDDGKSAKEIKDALMNEYDDQSLAAYVDSAYNAIAKYPTDITEKSTATVSNDTENASNTQNAEQDTKNTTENEFLLNGTYTHTKTGETMPDTKIQKGQRLDKITFTRLKNCAKRNNGYWSNYSKSFLFHDNSARDAFFNEASGILGVENIPDKVVESKQEKKSDMSPKQIDVISMLESLKKNGEAKLSDFAVADNKVIAEKEMSNNELVDNSGLQGISQGETTEGISKNDRERNAESVRQEASRKSGEVLQRNNMGVENGKKNDGRLQQESDNDNRNRISSEGNDKRNAVQPKLTPAQKKNAKASEHPGHNFVIKDDSGIGEGGLKQKYKDNVSAIKLLKELETANRLATPSEQKVLAKYVGWGGLSPVFNIYDDDNGNWKAEREELKGLLSTEEYSGARESTLSSFYTPISVIRGIYNIVDRLGFKGGRILDPSMGVGNYFGAMPSKLASNSTLNGIELDSLTGRIAKQLYQTANIDITGFENKTIPNNFYDLIISNVPFGDFKLSDPHYDKLKLNIHNYFFAKAIDKVRPGGIVCFITSTATMQNRADSALLRNLMSQKADLVGAIRLPDTTFKGNANTSVVSDLIILQKRNKNAAPAKFNKPWLGLVSSGIKSNDWQHGDMPINEYFSDNPDMIIGKLEVGGRYGDTLSANGKGLDVAKELADRIKLFPKNIYEPLVGTSNNNSEESTKRFLADVGTKEGAIIVQDGKAYQNVNGEMVEMPASIQKKAKDYVPLRESVTNILQAQINPNVSEGDLNKLRVTLNRNYDSFIKKHGYVNNNKNVNSFGDDAVYGIICATENYEYDKNTKKEKASKGDIYTKRTVNAVSPITNATSASDALASSLSQKGNVDIGYISQLLGKDAETAIDELKGIIFQDPISRKYLTADEYLSGNVRDKLEAAEEAAKTDSKYQENVDRLKAVQPVDLVPEEISVNMGCPWIPPTDIEAFANHLLDTSNSPIKIGYSPVAGTWITRWDEKVWGMRNAKDGTKATNTWGTSRRNLDRILGYALNQQSPVVKDTYTENGEKVEVVNTKETTAAQEKVRAVRAEFKKWIWSDKERTDRLVSYYNRNYNNEVLRTYNGSHLDLHNNGFNNAIELRPHQKDAVWRIMQGGNTLLAHCVGAGKTWAMQTAAMEMKRLGIANKSMFIIPNHMLKQFEGEFRQIYPNAKLLTISSKQLPDAMTPALKGREGKAEAEKRKRVQTARQKVLGKIAAEDWDGIIISHTMFKRIPMAPETYEKFYQEKMDELRNAIIEIKMSENGKIGNSVIKNLEKKLKSYEVEMRKCMAVSKKDIAVPFEELGVDQVFVDEADIFKNLYFPTAMKRVAGISNSDSQRSFDMYIKAQYLTNINNGRGVVFATGTPISNTMAEMFTMIRYLDPQSLKDKNLSFFDSWAANFATKETVVERSPDGQGYRQTEKFSSFDNMPELIKMFRKFADVKTRDEIKLDIPKLKNGKTTTIEIEQNSALHDYITGEIRKRAEAIHNKLVKPDEDNMLKLTSDLRKASLDMRLIDNSIPEEVANGKLLAVADHVYDKYVESNEIKGTQLVFCDLSTPKGVSDKANDNEENSNSSEDAEGVDITAYESIRDYLIKKGIPKEEISFIHDAKSDDQKNDLFAKVRNGDVRVLIGSTGKMGAGTNIQKRLVALHHVDAPWRPRDIEQREGRILRQGNINKEVEIFNYVTKDSFDANMWEKLKNKAQMIAQAMSNNITQRTIEDMDATVLSFGEVEAAASGNPLMAERVGVNAEVNKYNMLYSNYLKGRSVSERKLLEMPEKVQQARVEQQQAKEDIARQKDFSGDKFSMNFDGKTYSKRTDAEKALDKFVSDFKNEIGEVVGQIGGLDIFLKHVKPGQVVNLDGKIYTYANGGNVAYIQGSGKYLCDAKLGSIEYAASKAPQKALKESTDTLAALSKESKDLEESIKQPFEHEKKYRDLLKRQAEIDKELHIGEDNQQQSDTKSQTSSDIQAQAAYHGTQHVYDSVDLSHVGTGEGAAAHGWGFYTSEKLGTASNYRDALTKTLPQYDIVLSFGDQVYKTDNKHLDNFTDATGNVVNDDLTKLLKVIQKYTVDEDYESDFQSEGNSVTFDANTLIDIAKQCFDDFSPSDAEDAKNAEIVEKGIEFLKLHKDITMQQNPLEQEGMLLEVNIPENDVLLNEQKNFNEQPKKVQEALIAISKELKGFGKLDKAIRNNADGRELYKACGKDVYFAKNDLEGGTTNEAKAASFALNEYGVKGITYDGYRDGRCFVVFDADAVEIVQKYEAAIQELAPQIKRSMDDLKSEIKDAFNGAKITELEGNNLKVDTGNGVSIIVNLRDQIILNAADEAKARSDHSLNNNGRGIDVEGYYRPVLDKKAVLVLSQESRKGTGYHEAFHAAFNVALNAKEKAAMTKYFKPKADSKKVSVDEVMADAYRAWKRMRASGRGSIFGKLFQRISDFIHKAQAILTGTENVHNVLAKIESGEVWSRANSDKLKTSDIQYSARRTTKTIKNNSGGTMTIEHSEGIDAVADVASSVRNATENLGKALAGLKKNKGVTTDSKSKIIVQNAANGQNLGIIGNVVQSPSYIAEKFPKFKLFFKMADKAMHTQEYNRSRFNKILNRIFGKVSSKEDRATLNELLWTGDMEGKEYTREELQEQGAKDNVISAYGAAREAIRQAYVMLNEARGRVRTYQKNLTEAALESLKGDKFVEILKTEKTTDDNYLVTYKKPRVWTKHLVVDKEMYRALKADENVQIKDAELMPNGNYDVLYEQKAADIVNRKGYIPHFFHEFFVCLKDAKTGDKTVIGSGRTVKEAIKIAEDYNATNVSNKNDIVISPKTFNFGEEGVRAAEIGDYEYQRVVSSVMDDLFMSTTDAKEFLKGKVKVKARHRFFGNFMQRTGAEGFETDTDWVLKHYFNMVSRYVALEEFKPNAISLFERYYGAYDRDYTGNPLAHYTKQYISDVNGNPNFAETMVNNLLNSSSFWRNHIASNFGDRAALQAINSVKGKVSILKLGFLNISSAMLNLSQIVNAAGLTNDFAATAAAMKNVLHPSMSVRKILAESGLSDIVTLDTASGYTKLRPTSVLGKSMYLFGAMDMYSRKVAVLSAYYAGRKQGMKHKQAIQYAKDVNRKANFDYGVADAPNLFRRTSGSVVGDLALQFKKYQVKELELMHEILSKGSKAQNAKFWGTYFLIAGLLQVPAFDWFDDIWAWLFGASPKTKIKKMVFEAAGDSPVGKELAKLALYGLPAVSPINADVSSRVGVGDVTLSSKSGLANTLGGATVSTVKQLGEAVVAQDTLQAIKALSPALGNYMQVAIGHSQDKRGRKMRDIDGVYEKLLKATGFRNVNDSIASDRQTIISAENKTLNADRKAVIKKTLDKQEDGKLLTQDDIKELKRLGVTGQMLQNERKNRAMSTDERFKKNLSKRNRQENGDVINF